MLTKGFSFGITITGTPKAPQTHSLTTTVDSAGQKGTVNRLRHRVGVGVGGGGGEKREGGKVKKVNRNQKMICEKKQKSENHDLEEKRPLTNLDGEFC